MTWHPDSRGKLSFDDCLPTNCIQTELKYTVRPQSRLIWDSNGQKDLLFHLYRVTWSFQESRNLLKQSIFDGQLCLIDWAICSFPCVCFGGPRSLETKISFSPPGFENWVFKWLWGDDCRENTRETRDTRRGLPVQENFPRCGAFCSRFIAVFRLTCTRV